MTPERAVELVKWGWLHAKPAGTEQDWRKAIKIVSASPELVGSIMQVPEDQRATAIENCPPSEPAVGDPLPKVIWGRTAKD